MITNSLCSVWYLLLSSRGLEMLDGITTAVLFRSNKLKIFTTYEIFLNSCFYLYIEAKYILMRD